jgi:hypothetical protein
LSGEPSPVYGDQPDPFLVVRATELDAEPAVRALCAGYERGVWCSEGLAGWLFEYLPEFALRFSEYESMSRSNAVRRMVEAARNVYTTEKFKRRGEFGELLLHAALRQIFSSEPAVSKLYYKDGPNDTVKGFDAVHAVLPPGGELELWLGEVKFYRSIDKAMTDVAKELRDHFEADWLKQEFVAVARKLDARWPHAAALDKLLRSRRCLAELEPRIRVPVLLTYESGVVDAHGSCNASYSAQLAAEAVALRERFGDRKLPKDVRIELLLLPMHLKADLVKALDTKLRAWHRAS